MKIISINAGSSSLKFSLFEMTDKKLIANGLFERIGIEGSRYKIKYNGEKLEQDVDLPNHTRAVEILLDKLVALGIVDSLNEIGGVGHRLVHGGDKYKESVIITDEVVEDLRKFSVLAPLHNPANILGIEAVRNVLPDVPMVGVFDTAFHQTMEEVNYLYPVPYEWYEKHGVRKYGFHGTSHCYITKTISKELGRDDLRIISCHLGNGGSITAIKDGKCVDTSMGFTPLAGIMMGTRSGAIDPSIIEYVCKEANMDVSEVTNALNKKSGFLGLSEYSSDSRDIEEGMNNGNEKCALAHQKFVQTVVNYIATYYVELGGADVITFTAGIGENSIATRRDIVEKLACLGIKLDLERNNVRGELKKISSDDSSCLVYVVPTNEELMIATDTLDLITR